MRIICKKIFPALIFLGIFFIFSNTAQAACTWREELTTTNPELGTSDTSGGCSSQETAAVAGGETCTGTRPSGTYNGLSSTRFVCCCEKKVTETAESKELPKFTIPELSIEIPGMAEFSQGTCVADASGKTKCTVNWIGEYIGGIYKYATGIAGILAVIVLMIGGIIWLVSGGDATKITQSKELIIGAISGLAILLCSYIILYQINPDLTKFKSLTLGYIDEIDQLAKDKLGSTADSYKNMACPTEAELANGINFYATGYFKMPWQDNQDLRYLCMVAMQGTCPGAGTDSGSLCVENGKYIFPDYPNYRPCQKFTKAQYDDRYFKNRDLRANETIAGPIACGGKLAMSNQVCFNNKTYKITDSGGGIKGRRIDIFSSSLADAIGNTQIGTLKSGPCN